jgi:hypothetical protein
MQRTILDKTTMLGLGLVFAPKAGIQIDINPGFVRTTDGQVAEGSICTHDCRRTPDGGRYDCGAATSLNPGLIRNSFADWKYLVERIELTAQGLDLALNHFVQNNFTDYCREFEIPPEVSAVLIQNLVAGKFEANLFGGDPELHPGLFDIIRHLRQRDYLVNLTTTGGKFVHGKGKEEFLRKFLADPPNLIAVSAGDFASLEELSLLISLSLDELAAEWKKRRGPGNGQALKAVEGICVARLASEIKDFPTTVLFNFNIERTNVNYALGLVEMLSRAFPFAIVNPYPAQNSFNSFPGEEMQWLPEHLPDLRKIAEWMVRANLQGNPRISRRIQYWIFLLTALEHYKDDPLQAAATLSGYNAWRCYNRPIGSGLYAQIGRKGNNLVQISGGQQSVATQAGGYRNCFWQPNTINSAKPVESAEEGYRYFTGGMHKQAIALGEKACPGCLMPRLMFNMIVTELGLPLELIPTYLKVRKHYIGF